MGLLVGITGKTGAGKNLVASFFGRRGWRMLDLDLVAHQVLNQASQLISEEFGSDIMNSQGEINRKILGAKVFGQPHLLRKLETMTYPLIEKKTDEWIARDSTTPAVIHAINLHKTTFPKRCDAIIWVYAPRRIRRKRVMAREGLPWNALKERFKSQYGLKPNLFSSYAETDSVRNSGTPKNLERRLEEILHRL